MGEVEILFDGTDVDSDESAVSPSPRTVVQPGAPARAPAGTSPFGARHDSKWAWGVVITVVGVLALVAMGWFIYRLFQA